MRLAESFHYKFFMSTAPWHKDKVVTLGFSLLEIPEDFDYYKPYPTTIDFIDVVQINFQPDDKEHNGIFRQGKYKGNVSIRTAMYLDSDFLGLFWQLPKETQLKLVEQAEAFLIKENL